MWRRQAKSSHKGTTTVRPRRFLPRLEALETRLAPASCSWNPDSKVVTGDADGDTLTVIHRLNGGGYDLICNYFEYVATTPDIGLTFDAGPGSTLSIDHRLGGGWRHYEVEPGLVEDAITDVKLNFNENVQQLLVYFADVDAWSGTWNEVTFGRDGVLEHIPLTSVFGNDGNADQIAVNDSEWESGDTYRMTDSQLILPANITVNHYNVESVEFHTGSGSDTVSMKHTAGGSLVDLPWLYSNTGAGNDVITMDASNSAIGREYFLHSNEMKMMKDEFNAKRILTYQTNDTISLICGSGNDVVRLAHWGFDLSGMGKLNIDGGSGTNALYLDDTLYTSDGGETYSISDDTVETGRLGVVATYGNFFYLYLYTGSAFNNLITLDNEGRLAGLPRVTVHGNGEIDQMYLMDKENLNPDPYTLYPWAQADGNYAKLDTPSIGFALAAGVEELTLFTGPSNNVIDINNIFGELPNGMTFRSMYPWAPIGRDTINFYDVKNPAPETYKVTSVDDDGSGTLLVSSADFEVHFLDVDTLNLHTSLKPGTVVDTQDYNPAHYVLNVYNLPRPEIEDPKPPEEDPVTPPQPPPQPAPPPPGPFVEPTRPAPAIKELRLRPVRSQPGDQLFTALDNLNFGDR